MNGGRGTKNTIYLLSVPSLDTEWNDVLDFASRSAQDNWFQNKVQMVTTGGARVDAERSTLVIDKPLNTLDNIDYIYLYDGSRRYYYFVLTKTHKTPNSTELLLKLDVWSTYYFDWKWLESFVERCHVPRWNNGVPTQKYGDEDLVMGDYEYIEGNKLFTLQNTNIIVSSTPLGQLKEGGYTPPQGGGSDKGDCWLNGQMSPDGFRFLKGYEGFGPRIYSDSGGVPTIGYGTTASDAEAWKTLTASQPCKEQDAAQIAYKSLTNEYGKAILERVKQLGCTSQQQFDALVDLAYNAGTGRVLGDNELTLAIAKNPMDEAYIRPIWENFIIKDSAGNTLQGLRDRRKAEADIFFDGIYEKRTISYIPKYDGTVTENDGNGWLPPSCGGGGGSIDGHSTVSNQWGDNWLVPVKGQVTSLYGWRTHPVTGQQKLHKGVDVAAPEGTKMLASADGEVLINQWDEGFGHWLRIRHKGKDGKPVDIDYPHQVTKPVLPVGAKVKRGDVVGYVGTSGTSTGPHLHWQFNRGTNTINPAPTWKVGQQV